MSTELAVTAVTQTLRQILDDEIEHKWGTDVLSGDLTKERFITNLPPHKVRDVHATDSVVNLFLYRTDVSAAWRNMSPPVQGKPGETDPPPLAINLEYLVSAYGEDDREEVAHFFLGQAMRILHDVPLVPRQKLFDVLKKSRVHEQIERITVTPRSLSIEEISKLWSIFQTQYRISAAYLITVLLIDSKVAGRSPLPVLTRGPDDSGVIAVAALPPVLESSRAATGFGGVRLGEDVIVTGERFDARIAAANVRHPSTVAQKLPVTVIDPNQLKITIPAVNSAPGVSAAWPAGIYSLSLDVDRPGQTAWTTNEIPFVVAPSIAVAPTTVQPPAPLVELTIETQPQVRPTQTVAVLFGNTKLPPKSVTAPADSDSPTVLKVDVPGDVIGLHRVRVRVDGIDSIPVVRVGAKIEFDPNQSVEVKP
jgi:hypothetical protein